MNSKKTTNSQISTTEPKKKQKQTKLITRTGTESQKWRSHKGYQWRGEQGEWGKGTGNKKHKWQVQNRHGEIKNSIGNGEAKKLICTTHGHELRGVNAGGKGGAGYRGMKGRKKMGQLNSIINKIYFKK